MQWVSRSNHMGSIPVRVTMKRLPTPKGVGSLFISGLPVRESKRPTRRSRVKKCPGDTFLGRGRVEISKPPTIVREKPRQRQKGLGGHHEKPPYGNRRGRAGSARRQCARWLSTNRYFPDPPGIVTEQNGERKHLHCARIDSGGTPPVDTFLGRGRVEISKIPAIVREKLRQRQKGLGGHHEKSPYGNRRGAPGVNFGGQWPQPISHDSFLRIVTSLTRPVSAACPPNLLHIPFSLFPESARYCYRVEIDAKTQAPLVKGGWFCPWQNRGDSAGWQVST